MEKRRSFGYKPPMVTQEKMQENLRVAFKSSKQPSQRQFSWRPKEQKPISFKPTNVYKQPEPIPQQPSQEEEPYWTAEEWEDWCIEIYKNYPEMRKYLPAWFIEAVETEE